MRIFKIIIFLSLAANVNFVQANGSGNELINDCQLFVDFMDSKQETFKADEYVKLGRCIGISRAVRATMQILISNDNSPLKICWPKDGTDGQTARIIVKYLKENPEKLHQDGIQLAMSSLNIAFACPGQFSK
tara:strand:+ start:264 stop:659 length:396 start_codon:yes stop_codon:yes gene_type:complete